MFKRRLALPERPKTTFFLWGPRQTGKSTLLHARYPEAITIDLLKTDERIRYLRNPELMRQELPASGNPLVIIDEVQKVPELLDEVHWLIENRRTVFALCGSSARKLRRGHANLLGGRALRYALFGLVSAEIGPDFDLSKLLNVGYLPRHYLAEKHAPLLRAYVQDYLKEEILEEGLARRLPVFSDFLASAALSDGELVNFSTIARDCGVSSPTAREYFQILEDTLLGNFVTGYRKRPKRRAIHAPKFYFSDVGIVNHLAKRGSLQPGSELFGKAFENWVHHELRAHAEYGETHDEIHYWRLTTGREVDFIVNDMQLAVEAKASSRITSDHLAGLRELKADYPAVGRRIVVCLETKPRKTEDGIEILPYRQFAAELWDEALL